VKLYAKILPRYFELIKKRHKRIDFRQFESITFYNSETGEEIEHEILDVDRCMSRSVIFEEYPDVKWEPNKEIYEIKLGRRL